MVVGGTGSCRAVPVRISLARPAITVGGQVDGCPSGLPERGNGRRGFAATSPAAMDRLAELGARSSPGIHPCAAADEASAGRARPASSRAPERESRSNAASEAQRVAGHVAGPKMSVSIRGGAVEISGGLAAATVRVTEKISRHSEGGEPGQVVRGSRGPSVAGVTLRVTSSVKSTEDDVGRRTGRRQAAFSAAS